MPTSSRFPVLLAICLFLLLVAVAHADDTIRGKYCYTYGDSESLKEAREIAKQLAIRNALESYRTFVTATSVVKNFQLTNDLVQTISSGYLKNLRSVKHTEKGHEVCDVIVAQISPEAVDSFMRSQLDELSKQKTAINNVLDKYNEYSLKNKILTKDYQHLIAMVKDHLSEAINLEKSGPVNDRLSWMESRMSILNEITGANEKTTEVESVMNKIMENDANQYTLNSPYTDILEPDAQDYAEVFIEAVNSVNNKTRKSGEEILRAMDAMKDSESIVFDRANDKINSAFNETKETLKLWAEVMKKHETIASMITKQIQQIKDNIDKNTAAE